MLRHRIDDLFYLLQGARAWQRIDVAACKSGGEGSMRRKEGGGRFVVAGERKGSQGIANLEEGRRSWKIVDAVGRSVWGAATMENGVVNGGQVDPASQVSFLRS